MNEDVKKMMQDMQDRIREVAYLMWESAGRQHGMATEYWHAAEREVRATMEAAKEKMTKAAQSKPESKPGTKKPAAAAPKAKPAAAAPKPAAAAPKPAAKSESKPATPAAKAAASPAPKTAAPKPEAKKPASAAPKAPAKSPAKAANATGGYKVEEIEGIGPAYAKKLAAVGIETTDHLLDQCGSASARAATADKAGITAKLLLKWANMADLMRVSGVAGENAELLEAAGVDTVKELKMRKADNLAAKMAEVNAEKKLTRRVATAKQVEKWVEQAKTLEPRITH